MTLPRSDHFNGKTFFNPGEASDRGLWDLLRWKLTSRATPWPRSVPSAHASPPAAPTGDGIVATWVGHATFILRSATATILTDPVFSEVAGPFGGLGARRVTPPAVDLGAIPKVDLVLLSHDHYDHCDVPTLRRLGRRDDPLIVSPLGYRSLFSRAGLRRVVELDWWETTVCAPGLEATLVPARHWTRRAPFGTNRRLWGGFMLKAGGRRVYFAGDSGYRAGLFAEIGRRCGPPDLALLPIGAYEPRWFMEPAHMNPAEAVQVHLDVASRRSLAMHWGTFQLTDEGREAPVRALEEARRRAGLGTSDFDAPPPGASVRV
jgi:L-ascorbate metabolism protein UlaG (beta-lactamase superfamily)